MKGHLISLLRTITLSVPTSKQIGVFCHIESFLTYELLVVQACGW
jgi:hypothetical protein